MGVVAVSLTKDGIFDFFSSIGGVQLQHSQTVL
jgi:hypothetical protein